MFFHIIYYIYFSYLSCFSYF